MRYVSHCQIINKTEIIMKNVLEFIKNNVLEILLIFCVGVFVILYCYGWLIYENIKIRALITLFLISIVLIFGCGLASFSRKQVSEQYFKAYTICYLSVLATTWILIGITPIDYSILPIIVHKILLMIATTVMVIFIGLSGILIITGIEILKIQKNI